MEPRTDERRARGQWGANKTSRIRAQISLCLGFLSVAEMCGDVLLLSILKLLLTFSLSCSVIINCVHTRKTNIAQELIFQIKHSKPKGSATGCRYTRPPTAIVSGVFSEHEKKKGNANRKTFKATEEFQKVRFSVQLGDGVSAFGNKSVKRLRKINLHSN